MRLHPAPRKLLKVAEEAFISLPPLCSCVPVRTTFPYPSGLVRL